MMFIQKKCCLVYLTYNATKHIIIIIDLYYYWLLFFFFILIFFYIKHIHSNIKPTVTRHTYICSYIWKLINNTKDKIKPKKKKKAAIYM